ncbi:hypothetical protein SCA6_004533 [Theobroma cacao]
MSILMLNQCHACTSFLILIASRNAWISWCTGDNRSLTILICPTGAWKNLKQKLHFMVSKTIYQTIIECGKIKKLVFGRNLDSIPSLRPDYCLYQSKFTITAHALMK